jgi:hypothetical protein
MDRGSSKHGPQRDDEMERETEDITRTGEPQPGEEWRQTEPFDEPYSPTWTGGLTSRSTCRHTNCRPTAAQFSTMRARRMHPTMSWMPSAGSLPAGSFIRSARSSARSAYTPKTQETTPTADTHSRPSRRSTMPI